jgi:uncharacterized membrane protein YadS
MIGKSKKGKKKKKKKNRLLPWFCLLTSLAGSLSSTLFLVQRSVCDFKK